VTIASVGLLVIRAWVEDGSTRPLRAEIRLTADIALGFERRIILSEARPVNEGVRAWLEAVAAARE
jgi:hypothetical protein